MVFPRVRCVDVANDGLCNGGKHMKGLGPKSSGFHRKVLMDDMLDVVQVDLVAAIDVDGGQSYVRARANCRGCSCKTMCRSWLADHAQGTPQSFCPNAEFFRTVKDDN